LKAFDFIDIGAMLETSGAVPVVIKSLVFPTSSAVGVREERNERNERNDARAIERIA
jgi:ethanolamine utilization protein EutA